MKNCSLYRLLIPATFAVLFAFDARQSAHADVRLPKIFGNGMVLQQKSMVAIWGWGDPGEAVVVTLRGPQDAVSTATAKANDAGKWRAQLATPNAGGPSELIVKGNNEVRFQDVMLGEVWICSGQSNMEWTVAQSLNAKDEIAAANFPAIRMLTVAHNVAERPQDDINGAWATCNPQSAPGFSAVGYFFARHLHQQLGVPVGMINSSWGGTLCEAWTSREALMSDADFAPILQRGEKFQDNNPNQPAVLFNGMLHPLIPFGIRGAIWYQGESNVARAEQYRKLFPTMISDWRIRFGQGYIPFLFVQLAPFKYGHDPRLLAEQWESQLKTLSHPQTGMAVTTDIGNVVDIHPVNKQEVGRRLALWALANSYGKADLVYSGPLYESMAIEGNKIRIKFRHAAGGLIAEGGKPLSHFTIAGADQNFVDASAAIEGDSIVVQSDKVAQPIAVRFAWEQTAEPNLFNKERLPASPFRTDEFKLISSGAR